VPDFDPIADRYDRYRSIPSHVRDAFCEAVRDAAGASARVLEVGAGTGRIGSAFVAAGDAYVGSDPSRPMLEEFASKFASQSGGPGRLVQADGRALPFADAAFDAVILVSVLGGIHGWRPLLEEASRVLKPSGCLILGERVRPPAGVDALMKDRLAVILSEMGVDAGRPGVGRDEAFARLASEAARADRRAVARWTSKRTPRDFLSRHPTGARFAALPEGVRVEALGRLASWAMGVFPSLETEFQEEDHFEIYIFWHLSRG
jgi:SAM-dependent methyltransferase